ncbi:hydroxyisourate hydrolase [Acidiferrimicrobium sp. IK]|uniref:hydroxyisourate hydrolase n=1 Tax=Acidiferrimicrobium sp. IK TaxID=2871700 RepID=UPI0021CB7B18|nr:hydroxyisourate hydrolase [Acidiferrimicrobium sp. IK]MCU4184493.1 hydroxyisourate hydrolase [Acidiferrimicrobium sp. IK]
MPTLSTHVLDAAGGGARAGVEVTLRDSTGAVAGQGRTGPDGRLGGLGATLTPGTYRLTWSTEGAFLAEVSVLVRLIEDRHYHVPLLASGASAVTYLGV